MATRRERSLENTFHQYLRDAGHQPSRLRIRIAGQSNPLYTDTWDSAANELYEAKGSVSRNDVRLAVGQLLDYRRHMTPPPSRCTVLLPSDPGDDLTDLVHSSGMDLVYQEGNTFIRRAAPLITAVDRDETNRSISAVAASFPVQPGTSLKTQSQLSKAASPLTSPFRSLRNTTQNVVERD